MSKPKYLIKTTNTVETFHDGPTPDKEVFLLRKKITNIVENYKTGDVDENVIYLASHQNSTHARVNGSWRRNTGGDYMKRARHTERRSNELESLFREYKLKQLLDG